MTRKILNINIMSGCPQPQHPGQGLDVRGRGRGRFQPTSEDPLLEIRAERAVTKRRINAQKKLSRKREAQLEETLLPVAPPRRRQKNGDSAVRDARAGPSRSSPNQITGPSTPTLCSGEAEQILLPVAELKREAVEEYYLDCDTKEFYADIVSAATSTNNEHDPLCGPDDWLCGLTDEDDDHEDVIELTYHTNNNLAFACTMELTDTQAELLQAEDRRDDQLLRELVTDDCYWFDWNRDRQTFTGLRETFNETSGPTFDVAVLTQPIEVFDRMIDVDFLDRLCTETNRYAEQKIALLRKQNRLSAHSRLTRWTQTDRDEMITFLTVQVLQGLYPLPEEEAYFKFNGYGTMPYFAKIMSYNRFLLLKMMMHFVDNENMTDRTSLGKIQPVIDYFNDKFSSLYMPAQEIVIDESLLKWHGRLSVAQKIPTKAAQVGVKTYELCEAASGYLWRFSVYAGKHGANKNRTSDGLDGNGSARDDKTTRCNIDRPTNTTSKIVYDLLEPLLERGHTLIMDSFYNSPLLSRCLKRHKTDCFGTLRLNREFVPDTIKTLTKNDMRQGEVVATYCSDLSILVWRDARLVGFISTYHNLEIGNAAHKPQIVVDYNRLMGGMDRKEQFLSAQPVERIKNKVWYKKLFRRLYNAAVYNSYVIFASAHNISHRKFRVTLAEQLLTRHRYIDLTAEPRRINIRSPTTGKTTVRTRQKITTRDRPNLDHNHFPIQGTSRFLTCRVCPQRKRTSYKCEECNVPLCIINCFKAYHKH